MHPRSLDKLVIKLNNSLKELNKDYETLRLNFDKYVAKSEAELNVLQSENQQLREELASTTKLNEDQANVIVGLKRKLGLDNTNSSIPSSKIMDFKKNPSASTSNTPINSAINALNLLSKLQLFVGDQTKLPSLSKTDRGVIELLLSTENFTSTGCYYNLNGILQQLLYKTVAVTDTVEVMQLLSNEQFKLVADYKLRGGAVGHKGSNLQQSETPDEIRVIMPSECSCGCNNITIYDEYESRQQINLKIERIITEHRLIYGRCNQCGKSVKAKSSLPSNISYHPMIRGYAVYMLDAHYMPYERLSIYFKDVFGLAISEGSINNWRKEFAKSLGEEYIPKLKALLLNASYLHADETGLNVAGSNLWTHVVCNGDGAILHISPKRGAEGITASDILNNYHGTLIADGWAAYKKLPYIEGIQACFAHLFRYFKDVSDNYQQTWSTKMASLLKFGLDSTKRLLSRGITEYSEAAKLSIINKYVKLVEEGEVEVKKCNYAIKGHPAYCLIKRLKREQDSILRFLNNIQLPLTNNDAERSIRPIKVQQKISGTSLSIENAQENLDIRSFTATCKKQKINVLDTMYRIFNDSSDFELRSNTS